ncbi:hypothetical protein G7Y89_g7831 [Cudoniella acicularis]|uniref:Probable beta-glucosidase G n=1 Tax=Cudoniella acicularis TaxID=354080 RepID=A0A8H4RHN9_9HELO|nr:hypothetical protein G7Y89_g7831 [Cudoniella acicularis]
MHIGNILLVASTAVLAVAAPTIEKKSKAAKKFQWFGVNESGAEFGNTALPGRLDKDYTWPPTATIDTLVGKGLNAFRVPIMMERIIPTSMTSTTLNATYESGMTTYINYITSKGAYAILDPHNFARYYGKIIDDYSGFEAFWKTLATVFKDNKLVIFDCNNEPHDMGSVDLGKLMQACINGVRSAGATSQTTSSGNDKALVGLTDPSDKLIYEMHQYLDSDGSGTSATCVSATIGSERLKAATAWLKANNKKAVLGEFAGGANSVCESAVKDMLTYMGANNDVWLGALWWGGGPWWGTYIYTSVSGNVLPFKKRDVSATYSTSWASAISQANNFVNQLNLTEKVGIVTGGSGFCIGNIAAIPRVGFTGICLSDGPTAVNRMDLVSIFPAGLTIAASWDKDLMYQRGFALGSEFKAKGSHVGLGPVAGPLGRSPLGGRNWEGFSPDPYLTGIAMINSITGMQNAGTQSSSKHFIGNEQETQRTNSVDANGDNIDAVSSNIDDRTLHELYLWPFADAVKAGTASVMCSYNRVNETYSCENSPLLNNILKNELGFQGYVVSDWFATHSGAKSANAGLDLTMPGYIDSTDPATSYFGANLTEAVSNGTVSVARLNDMAQRVMTPYFLLGQDKNFPTLDPSSYCVLEVEYETQLPVSERYSFCNTPARDVRSDHATIIRNLGAAGTVLLKNSNQVLPLKTPKTIGVFGNDAADLTDGLTFVDPLPLPGFDIGTLDVGGGSGSGRHTYIVSPIEAIKSRARSIGARVEYITSNAIISTNDFHSIYPTPDVCLVFLKTFTTEGYDRTTFEADWNSTLVVSNVAKRCPNTVVITHSGGINTMPWATNPNVTAILAAHYPGQESGNSIVDILWGDVNPSGRLPYTIPVNASDYDIPIANFTDATIANAWQSNFTEGLLIDYRHFDAKNITPLYEFGFGLSCTNFSIKTPLTLSTLTHTPSTFPASNQPIAPGGNPDLYTPLLNAKTSVTNTGSLSGSTVVQLYVSLPQASVPAGTPIKVLRGFEKVPLNAGETQTIEFQLVRRDLSYWDVDAQNWKIPTGQFTIAIGFSSRDLKSSAEIDML